MNKDLQKVALRKNALFIPSNNKTVTNAIDLHHTTSLLVANCANLGFTFSEELLREVNQCEQNVQLDLFNLLKEVKGVEKNWMPLVKQWDIPTNESVMDHKITFFANVFQKPMVTKLACGHYIPENTFPLERYNGCPFCGTPFEFEELKLQPSKNKLTVLELWTVSQLKGYLISLLESPVALDATQKDDLKILIKEFGVSSDVDIKMKETTMLVIDYLVENDMAKEAQFLFKSPNDVLRYLWYKHTGFLQIIEVKTLVSRQSKNNNHLNSSEDSSALATIVAKEKLKLKFTRKECRQYATWLTNLSMDVKAQCELMHSKRNIWVRVIRALRLAEYSKKKGFKKLAIWLDTFYNKDYEVWQGKVNHFKLKSDADQTFSLLKKRPGAFARSLFSTMLWFGPKKTIEQFEQIIDQIPSRLVITLDMYAENYFNKNNDRSVQPLGGVKKSIPPNKMLQFYDDDALRDMQELVKGLTLTSIKNKFLLDKNDNKTMFIEDVLYRMPLAIGDRSETIQDTSSALMGTRFKVEGDKVRLFLQWGEGLPAQHLDMDLSCQVAYIDKVDYCSYSRLTIDGCQHSGDIRHIPDKVGTAEYIDVNINTLLKLGAKYVTFTCNAFTNGSLTPNLVVGWMNSKYPMKISKKGVAYDPSAVQHQIRISQSVTKGLVFGMLNIEKREIVWLEMSFQGQRIQNLDVTGVETFLKKLEAKTKIGELLKIKSEVHELDIVKDAEAADEVYDLAWAKNTSEVSRVLLG
ncbi:hypothetical protein KMW28_22730 [Flammeovirga yaeyamensis]|uniref:Prokaryotic RING finger family 4 n=1 Tax=Flammeovirga yaeyamensis TaxID=367791 RepID=A0AAX1NCJ1_9BACT|nr:hypothetical protein [Flammeovirga yaeyamensis]MBB3696822.1 hypothetical protein [Flammeovirga yaeyamensis]QWG05239.1 hypothetical protein KMW28_22730 [Flammeovirga yaeyamensis]